MSMSNPLDGNGLQRFFNGLKSKFALKKAGVYVVKGTQTETTASWTGNIDLDALYDGLTIAYYLPTTSASNVTLNLTLSDGTTTGAVAVYYSGTTRMTTHYAAGSTIYLTYWSAGSISVNGTPTTNARWTHSDYNADNNAYQMYLNTAIKAKTAITAGFLVCGDGDGYSNVAKGVSFDIAYPILHSSNAIAANATRTDLYLTRYFDFTTTNGGTSPGFTSYKAVWLKGKLVGSVFTIDSTTMWTQTIPSTEDGFQYYYIGYAYNATSIRMMLEHPIFEYSGGSWHLYNRIDPKGSTSIPVYIDTDGKPQECNLTQYLNAGVGFYTEGVADDTTIYVSTDIVVTSSSNRWINGRIEGSRGNSTAPLIVYFMMYWNKTGISAFRYYDPLSGINNFSAHIGDDNKVYFSFKQATRYSAIRMFVYENSRNTGNINYVTSISVTAPENITFVHTYDGIRHYSELKDSGVSAGSYGPSANATPSFGSTFNVPYVTVDAKGRLTAASTKTVKIPNAPTIPSASSSNPIMDGTASPGSSSDWARGDHVHPSDTTKLSLTGGTMTGDLTVPTISHVISSLTRGSSYIHTPEGGSYFVASESTGYLKITLPVSPGSTGNRSMLQFTVNIYNHKENNSNKSSNKYYISGYNYTTGWSRPTAYSIGNYNNWSNLNVIFGNDGTKAAIWIGAADTEWSYPIVQVTDVMVAYENFGIDTWSSGWSITIDSTTPASISTTITNPHVGNGLPISAITNLQTTLDGKVSKSGDTMTGNLELPTSFHTIDSTSGAKYIHTPDGGFMRISGNSTGYIRITLPTSWSNTFVQFTVQILDYISDRCCEYHIFGNTSSTGGGQWAYPQAYSLGKYNAYTNKEVTFGHDGTHCIILIGKSTSTWNHSIVQIKDLIVGNASTGIDKWSKNWKVELSTDTTFTSMVTISNPHIGYDLPISAITNLQTTLDGKAPTSHASSGTTYGVGTSSNYGHLKLSDSTSSTSGTSDGVAATPSAVKSAYDLANGKADKILGIWYGECSTAASTQEKAVTISGITSLQTGISIRVKFTNAQSYNGQPTLNLNSLGAVNIVQRGSSTAALRYEWLAGEALDFVYDGTNWVIVNGGIATTTYYGVTKLSDSVASTSTSVAATPKAVKAAYDLADSKFDATGGTIKGSITLDPDDSSYPTILLKSDADSSGNFGYSLIRKYATNSADYGTLIYDSIIGDGRTANTEFSYLALRRNLALANQLRLVYAYKDENDTMQTTTYTIYGTHNKPSPADVGLNRTNAVDVANTSYTTLMARGESLNSTATTPAVNGAIAWQYE